MGLSDFKLAVDWITKLAGIVKKGRDLRIAEIERLGDVLLIKPLDLAPLYIAPDCQPYNPADHHEEDELDKHFRTPAFEFIETFIRTPVPNPDGSGHLFVLSDAGMGKTSLMAMFKLAYIQGFWPPKLKCIAFKLGSGTLDEISNLKGRGNTILLLDSLDEDPTAIGRIEERLSDLLNATKHFARVILTCRTQFFPRGGDDVFQRQDRINLGPYNCPVIYISMFNDGQVLLYLRKRYPARWFRKVLARDNPMVSEAQAVVNTMDTLRFRPMLLSYIDDFVQAGCVTEKSIYEVFNILVDAWLNRELRKGIILDKGNLRKACIFLAFKMTLDGRRTVSPEQIGSFRESHPELKSLPEMILEGRSLLNRTSDGGYRFSHYSVQEFFFIENLPIKGFQVQLTELMIRFLYSKINPMKKKGYKFVSACLGVADYFLKTGEINAAIDLYKKGLTLDPSFAAAAHNGLGNAYGRKGEYDLAIKQFDLSIVLNPKSSAAYHGLGSAYGKKGEYNRAIVCYDKSIALNSSRASVYHSRGYAYSKKGEYELAIIDYNRALELDPNLARAYDNRGWSFINRDDFKRAIEDYNRAIALDPKIAEAYNHRGLAFLSKDKIIWAIKDFDRAISLNPRLAQAYNNRGSVHASKGEAVRAIENYSRAIELHSNYIHAYINRGNAYASQGMIDRANADFDIAIALDLEYTATIINIINRIPRYDGRDVFRGYFIYDHAIAFDPENLSAFKERWMVINHNRFDLDNEL